MRRKPVPKPKAKQVIEPAKKQENQPTCRPIADIHMIITDGQLDIIMMTSGRNILVKYTGEIDEILVSAKLAEFFRYFNVPSK